MSLSPATLVTSDRVWQECLARLQTEPRFGIDLEANSMYAYRERVCLIQISIPTQDYIVDPLAIENLDGLGRLIANQDVEKIFHAAEYDLILLKRQYGWQCTHLFDTMWAARILGYERYGLANLLQELYGVAQNKKHQKANWCKRPLTADLLKYAQLDTHYLLPLRDHLAGQLAAQNHLEEALEIFADQTKVSPNAQTFDPDGFWGISGAYDLPRQQQAVLKALYAFRDQQAERSNLPLFKVMSDRTLLELAQSCPATLRDLYKVHGMSEGQVRRYGRQLLSIIAESQQAEPPRFPKRNNRPPEEVTNRFEKLHIWRKEKAQVRGVESDVILSRDCLWAIAFKNPRQPEELSQIEQLGEWRRQMYGTDIIKLLQNHTGG
ncbi:MAG: ribonuclease D [Chloroflexota bacterium]|nr:ribonuclease D [Ardenticatenaceae bacterium]GIK58786.1 MAG: ribonuclease D [Chloroflexota bacterium]